MENESEHEVSIKLKLDDDEEVISAEAKCNCSWVKVAETRQLALAYSQRHLLHNKLWPYEEDDRPDEPWPF